MTPPDGAEALGWVQTTKILKSCQVTEDAGVGEGTFPLGSHRKPGSHLRQ